MLGYWGYLMFEVNDDWWQFPENIERTAEARYDTYYPANTEDRPRKQFLGPDSGKFTFDMYIDNRFTSSVKEMLSKFVEWCNTGVAGELVIGTKVYGFNKWVCTRVVEKDIELVQPGVLTRARVQVTLEET